MLTTRVTSNYTTTNTIIIIYKYESLKQDFLILITKYKNIYWMHKGQKSTINMYTKMRINNKNKP
jgi:hypothetical protein